MQVGKVSDFKHPKEVTVDGKKILILSTQGKMYAVSGLCTHKNLPLAEGDLDGTCLTCPWHGAIFDVASGKALSGPTTQGLETYTVTVNGDDVSITL